MGFLTVNNFIIEENDGDFGQSSENYLVFHPVYDGTFVNGFNTVEEARSFCESEDYNLWTERLL